MADTSQERTEQPTEKKLRKSREEGQIPRSREVLSAVLIMSAGFLMQLSGPYAAGQLEGILRYNLSFGRNEAYDLAYMFVHLKSSALTAVITVVPFVAILAGAAIASSGLTGGFLFETSLLQPKFNRMNPAQWIGRVFSVKGLVEVGKSMLKIILVIGCLLFVLWKRYPLSLSLGSMPIMQAIYEGCGILGWTLLAYGSALLLIALIDAPYQIWDNKQKLMMTRQEVQDEHKDVEGKPEVKSKIRQLQREMSNRRMMQSVPEADVIITNPTHYSIAIKYDLERASAPFVTAKGADQTALKIREIARECSRPIVEAPHLTRAIYYSTKVDQEIPADLYLAVAQVLAYVQQLDMYRRGQGGNRPPVRPGFKVPDEYDDEGWKKKVKPDPKDEPSKD
ncbi:flagellar biosynthesis protein FlhB [Sansalvadorimonas sp. 2012CJ34-2]|uniref:Flagellar biosynthetic protein FlhB n=1 Tax=Parendozoicomonas callyspongiae TaxID=2942213 RepID=A0ABT0PFJ8_9GAMM|nr:flagellar biosynthesis protein FlhB [Sansalvadorimonas sp. 2012CJ34-2]MCL6270135.1 flagellar biosynthesis protein FlhB [Sansalvadorimonas sp. 2012CJ34-2]